MINFKHLDKFYFTHILIFLLNTTVKLTRIQKSKIVKGLKRSSRLYRVTLDTALFLILSYLTTINLYAILPATTYFFFFPTFLFILFKLLSYLFIPYLYPFISSNCLLIYVYEILLLSTLYLLPLDSMRKIIETSFTAF